MSRWSEFYSHKSTPQYREYLKNQYSTFIEIVKNVENKVILEAGCGTGAITRILKDMDSGNKYIAGDICLDMLKITSETVPGAELIQIDITKPLQVKADLIHSHGVLEHLSDEQIIQTIDNQLKICNKLIHYVPGINHKIPSFGDERLMTVSNWKKIAKPTKIVEFNCGHDYVLIWE